MDEGACEKVMRQDELLSEILDNMELDLPMDPPIRLDQEFRVSVLLLIRRLYELERVSHAFRRACVEWRGKLFKRAKTDLDDFNALAIRLIAHHLDIVFSNEDKEEARRLRDERKVWATFVGNVRAPKDHSRALRTTG